MQKGEVFRLRAPRGVRGRELAGPRFGVVLQATELSHLSTAIVAPTSTRVRPTPLRPEVVIDGEKTFVVVEQLTAVDRDRLGESHGLLKLSDVQEIDRALVYVFDLAG